MNDDTIREWATSQGFEQFVRDHATVMSNLSKWLASRQSEPDQPRAEVEASEETADTEANGYPLTEAWLERDEWRARFEAECEVRRNWAIRADIAEAECDRLREEICEIRNKANRTLAEPDDMDTAVFVGIATMCEALLDAETPEPAPKPEGLFALDGKVPTLKQDMRTCETCAKDSDCHNLHHGKGYNDLLCYEPAASDGKGEAE